MVRVELKLEMPVCIPLPIEILSPEQAFPFLDCTLADLGIAPSAVKERVVWLDNKRTQVRSSSGKLREKEMMVLEVRVKAQRPGDRQIQEVLYSTESHTTRSFGRSCLAILPWKPAEPEKNLQPLEVTLALDTELKTKWQKTEKKQEL